MTTLGIDASVVDDVPMVDDIPEELAPVKVKKERAPKLRSHFVVGKWNGEMMFTAATKQPEAPIYEFMAMVKWTRANYSDAPGQYAFVQASPKRLTIAKQEVMKSVLE